MKLVIALEGVSDMPPARRREVEQKYGEALEVVFGSPMSVWTRYEAAQRAALGQPTPQAARDRNRWDEIATIAAGLALGGLPYDTADAVFRVSLTESPA